MLELSRPLRQGRRARHHAVLWMVLLIQEDCCNAVNSRMFESDALCRDRIMPLVLKNVKSLRSSLCKVSLLILLCNSYMYLIS